MSAVAASHTSALAAGPSGWSRSDRGSCSPTTTAEPERPACGHMHAKLQHHVLRAATKYYTWVEVPSL